VTVVHGPTLAPECKPIPTGEPRAFTWLEATCVWCLRGAIGLKKARIKELQRRLNRSNKQLDGVWEAAEAWRTEEQEHIRDAEYGIAEGLNIAATAVEGILANRPREGDKHQ